MDKLLEEIKSLGKVPKKMFKVHFAYHFIIVFRLVQYLSRAIYDTLQQANISSDFVEKLKSFEYILSSFRKCEILSFFGFKSNFYLIIFFSVTFRKMFRCFLFIPIINSQSRFITSGNINFVKNFPGNFFIRWSYNLVQSYWTL